MRLKRLVLKFLTVAAAGVLLEACGGGGGGDDDAAAPPPPAPTPPPPAPAGTNNLLKLVRDNPAKFSVLAAALEKSGVAAMINGDGSTGTLTLLAPTDTAFNQLAQRIGMSDGSQMVQSMNAQQLANILSFNLLQQRFSLAALQNFSNRGFPNDRTATLYTFDGQPADMIFARNAQGGVVLWDGIGRDALTLDLTQTDAGAVNGVLHALNDVPVPRGVLTVSQILRASIDSFSDFRASMSGGLIDQLSGQGPFTVFVPNNDAVQATLADATVRFHVMNGLVGAASFPQTSTPVSLTSISGRRLTLSSDNKLRNASGASANVIDVDFYGTNGVVHVVDAVLPPA